MSIKINIFSLYTLYILLPAPKTIHTSFSHEMWRDNVIKRTSTVALAHKTTKRVIGNIRAIHLDFMELR